MGDHAVAVSLDEDVNIWMSAGLIVGSDKVKNFDRLRLRNDGMMVVDNDCPVNEMIGQVREVSADGEILVCVKGRIA